MKKLTALLLLLPVLASADPGSATKYLINESASLMDIGMLKVSRSLEEEKSSYESTYRNVAKVDFVEVVTLADYIYADDQISMSIWVIVKDFSNAEKGCRYLLSSLHVLAHEVLLPYSFGHSGYKTGGQPTDLIKQLKQRTKLECVVRDSMESDPRVTVSRTLTSSDIAVTNHEDER